MFGGPRVGGSEVWRFGGSEVLSSRWFNIQTSECYREFKLFNRRLALMYNGRAEARMREWEYWNSLIYQKRKGENWDEDMKMNSEFKRTKMERWRQMKTEMWSGFSEVIQSLESDRKCVVGFGVLVSIVLEYWRMVRTVKILSWCVIIRDRHMRVLRGTRGRLRYVIDSGRLWSMVADGLSS